VILRPAARLPAASRALFTSLASIWKAPGGWNYINSYTVVIKGSVFGAAGFGSVSVPDQHNSPNKYGAANSMVTSVTSSTVTNVATGKAATAPGGAQTLVVTSSASVDLVVAPQGGSGISVVLKTLANSDVDIVIQNDTAADVFLSGVTVTWPAMNGLLSQVILDGDVVYDNPDLAGPTQTLTLAQLAADQNKRKIQSGTSDVFRLNFTKRSIRT